MNKNLFIGFIGIVLLGGGFIFFQTQQNKNSQEFSQQQVITPKQEKKDEPAAQIEGFTGTVLAGKASPYLEFNKADYEKALASEKIILLDFYANWCPICRAEEPEIKAGFDLLTTDAIIGFRVNFNDPDTDATEKQLAKEFNVPYQHTKIFLKNGKEVSRSVDEWNKNEFLKQVNEVNK